MSEWLFDEIVSRVLSDLRSNDLSIAIVTSKDQREGLRDAILAEYSEEYIQDHTHMEAVNKDTGNDESFPALFIAIVSCAIGKRKFCCTRSIPIHHGTEMLFDRLTETGVLG